MRFASPASGPGKASPASLVNSKGESYDIDGFGVIALRQGDCDRLPRYRVENRDRHCSPPSLGHSPNKGVGGWLRGGAKNKKRAPSARVAYAASGRGGQRPAQSRSA